MEVAYLAKALQDRDYWLKHGNKAIQNRIILLIESIQKSPFSGIGKPEPLKYELLGKWSRRIDKEHRLVYAVYDDKIFIYSMRGHY